MVQRYGVSSSSMEKMLARVAHALRLRGQFLATPAQVQSILWDLHGDNQRQHLSAAKAGSYDLNKLAQVSEMLGGVLSGNVKPDAGLERILEIDRVEPEYGPWLNGLAFVFCGLGFGIILGIPWLDVFLGGALGLVSFGVSTMAARSQNLARSLEIIVAAAVSILATVLATFLPDIHPLAVTACACIFFVPGFGLTLGASELVNGNTLSGIIGFTQALITGLKLLIGTMMGVALVSHVISVPPLPKVESGIIPHIWTWVAAPMLVLGLAVLFRVRRKDLVWPLSAGVLVWAGVGLGSELGFWQGTFIGAFLLTLAGQVFSRVKRLPADIILLPAVMLLVPGFTALSAMYKGQSEGLVSGFTSAVDVFVLIGAILGGLLAAEAVWNIYKVALTTVASKFLRRKPR